MFCHNCGANWPDGTRFCSNCGAAMGNNAPVYTPPVDEDATVAVRRVGHTPAPAAPAAPSISLPDDFDEDRTVRVRRAPADLLRQAQAAAPCPPKPAPVVAPQPEPVVAPQPARNFDSIIENEFNSHKAPDFEISLENKPVFDISKEEIPDFEITIEEPDTIEPVIAPKPEPVIAPKPEPVIAPKPEPVIAPKPEPVIAPKPEPVIAPKPEPVPVPVVTLPMEDEKTVIAPPRTQAPKPPQRKPSMADMAQQRQAPTPPAPKEPRYVPSAPPRRSAKTSRTPLTLTIPLLMVFSLVLILLSGITALSTNVSEMGAVKWTVDLFWDFDLTEALEDLDDTRQEIADKKADLTGAELEHAEDLDKELERIQKKNSLPKLIRFGQYLIDEEENIDFDVKSMDSVKKLVDMKVLVYILLIVLCLLPMVFNLMGGLTRSTTWNIVAMLLALLAQLLLSTPVLLIILTMVVCLGQVILCSIVNTKTNR